MQTASVCQHNMIPRACDEGVQHFVNIQSLSLKVKLDLALSKHYALGYIENIKAFCMVLVGAFMHS